MVAWRAALAALDLAPDASQRFLDMEHPPTHDVLVRSIERWVLDPATGLPLLPGTPLRWTLETNPPSGLHSYSLIGDAIHLAGPGAIGERVRAELIQWALGLGDPVAARAAARGHTPPA